MYINGVRTGAVLYRCGELRTIYVLAFGFRDFGETRLTEVLSRISL